MIAIYFKQREAFSIEFTVVDIEEKAIDLTSADLYFCAKKFAEDATTVIEKLNASTDWDRSKEKDGKITMKLSSTDTNLLYDKYLAEFKVVKGDNIFKSESIQFWIDESLST